MITALHRKILLWLTANPVGIVGLVLCMSLGVLVVQSCSEPPVIDTTVEQKPDFKKNATQANRYLVEREETKINSYVERRGWSVVQLPCGARVHEYEHGEGAPIGNDDKVTIRYTVSTLAGQTIYADSVQTFVAGRLEPCEGLDAAVRTLRRGCSAHAILPSAVAYGVVGDGYRIKPRTPLVYDLHIK